MGCSIEGCEKDSYCRGWCQAHYKRWERHGDPLKGRAPDSHSNRGDTCSAIGCESEAESKGLCFKHYARMRRTGDPTKTISGRTKAPKHEGPCAADGCDDPARIKGFCEPHYKRWKAHGDPLKGRTKTTAKYGPDDTCLAEGCEDKPYGLGYCITHYGPFKHHGDPHYRRKTNLDRLADLIENPTDECIDPPWGKGQTYPSVSINNRTVKAARVVCEWAYGPPPDKAHSLHAPGICHNPRCVNPRHLRWGSAAENVADKTKDGTEQRGQTHPLAKLTEADVHAIREAAANGEPNKDIASRYPVGIDSVQKIIARKQWTHV